MRYILRLLFCATIMCSTASAQTVIIELPQNWNKLMEEKGYKPISEFYIK